MGIFRRKDKAEPAEQVETATDVTETDEVEVDEESADDTSVDTDAVETDVEQAAAEPAKPKVNSRDVDRSNGPFDRSEVDDLEGRIDFGAIAIAPVIDMELRLDISEDGQEITGLTAVVGESACQIQVFAAPKSRGVWDEIRGEIHDNLLTSGGTAEQKDGELGSELHVRMAAKGADGRTSYSPATFIGVDGPRWFLRAVLSGKAAMEAEAQAEMMQLIRGSVITRGGEPRAPREMLPLRIPENAEMPQELEEEPTEDGQDLPNPFDRGPEITEVR